MLLGSFSSKTLSFMDSALHINISTRDAFGTKSSSVFRKLFTNCEDMLLSSNHLTLTLQNS